MQMRMRLSASQSAADSRIRRCIASLCVMRDELMKASKKAL